MNTEPLMPQRNLQSPSDPVLDAMLQEALQEQEQHQQPESARDFALRHDFPIPTREPFKWRKCLLVVLGAITATLLLGRGLEALRTTPAIETPHISKPSRVPMPTPQSALPPASIPRTASLPQRPEPVQLRTPAPRAALVKLPPPRAALVRLPAWQPGTSRLLYMPYRLEVVGQLQGRLSDETLLPQSGNSIGDTWMVGNTPWVWITAPGTTSPQWIDP